MNRDKFFIGGDWVDPAGTDTIEVISPHTEEVIGQRARGDDRRRRPRRRRRARGLRPRPVAADVAGRARRRHGRSSRRASRRATRRSPTLITEEMGSPISFSIMGQVFAADHGARLLHRPRPRVRVRGAPPGVLGPALVRREPVGVVGAHRAVERAAVRHHAEARPRRWRRARPSCSSPRRRRRSTRYLLAEVLAGGRAARGRRQHRRRPAARSASTSSRHPGVDKIAFTGSPPPGKRSPRCAASS